MFKHTIRHITAGKVKFSKSCGLVRIVYDLNISYFPFRVLKFTVLACFYAVILAFPVYGWDLMLIKEEKAPGQWEDYGIFTGVLHTNGEKPKWPEKGVIHLEDAVWAASKK